MPVYTTSFFNSYKMRANTQYGVNIGRGKTTTTIYTIIKNLFARKNVVHY